MVGAAPSFSETHLVRALLVLSQGQTGRKNLVKILGLGEGSVRTIIKKLTRDGLLASKPRGQELSAKGRKQVESYLKKFTKPEVAGLDIVNKKACVIILHEACDKITTGLNEREIAVRAGADGAILLKHINGKLTFPCEDISLDDYPKTKNFLAGKKLVEKDLLVIGFAGKEEKAVDGALAIALNLLS
ncbi:MAG: hypothetical protein FJY77_05595 [Candidatus Altiarchaeales archaeon]|nr:hypothetical protein [Candidatus Altiarchaeales archaeon]